MPPTPDRTTIKATVETLTASLRTGLVAEPPTATKPFRAVVVADAGVDELPRPFIALKLTRARPFGLMDGEKVMEVTVVLRIVADATAADAHAGLLDRVGAVDDYLDFLLDTGVLDGAEGFDDREWVFSYP
ncbi:MAG: hypothetical protein ACE5EX_02350, partial [Phycisphaerae bacterium]